MRPAISDSLISGQPLYLLYSNSNFGAPLLSAPFAAALATQATGSVRLHVTGSPPTSKGLGVAAETGSAMVGSAAASAPRSTCRRLTRSRGPGDSGSIGVILTMASANSAPTRTCHRASASEMRMHRDVSKGCALRPYDFAKDGRLKVGGSCRIALETVHVHFIYQ